MQKASLCPRRINLNNCPAAMVWTNVWASRNWAQSDWGPLLSRVIENASLTFKKIPPSIFLRSLGTSSANPEKQFIFYHGFSLISWCQGRPLKAGDHSESWGFVRLCPPPFLPNIPVVQGLHDSSGRTKDEEMGYVVWGTSRPCLCACSLE